MHNMDINQFIIDVNAVNWRTFTDVPSRLKALALADKESREGIDFRIKGEGFDLLLNAKIKSGVLDAIGNNHCGSYCQVVEDTLPFIIEVALYGNHVVARNCAINALIDLYSFCPDVDTSDDLESIVKGTIRDAISKNKANFMKFADDDKRNISLIHDSLMSIIDEGCRAGDTNPIDIW